MVLSFPLYMDSTPAAIIRAMELTVRRRNGERRAPFLSIVNNGFVEASQSDIALRISRLFSRDAGLEWTGGLALGGGPAMAGRPLGAAGGMAGNARAALDQAAGAMAEGSPDPPEAVELDGQADSSETALQPPGSVGRKQEARRNGVRGRLCGRPFAKEKGRAALTGTA